MTFEEAYRELEEEFQRRVDADYKEWEFESVYLPNSAPESPVDYVLVAMEPSLRGWARDIPDAREKTCKKHARGSATFAECGNSTTPSANTYAGKERPTT